MTSAAAARPAGSWYVLGILFLVYTVNYFDRQILSILLDPIRRDLGLSDTALGFLSGIGFFLFYALCGIPIARAADRYSRRNIIAACLVLWSGMTALCGLAQNFLQLALSRMGVAVGEGGSGPAAHSMIADLFPHGKRAMALAIYSCGVPFGMLLGLALGGWINQAFDWRTAFIVAGLPGILLAIIMMLTVPEPTRAASTHQTPLVPWNELKTLWRIKSFRFLALGTALDSLGLLGWNPAYLARTFELGSAEIGLKLGLIIGLIGGVGTFLGGFLADKLAVREPGWYGRLPGLCVLATIPFASALYLTNSADMAFFYLCVPALMANVYLGPVFGTVQTIAPTSIKATSAAILLFILAIAQAIGPQVTGLLSDAYGALLGRDGLRYALLSIVMVKFVSVYFFMKAAKSLPEDLAGHHPPHQKEAK